MKNERTRLGKMAFAIVLSLCMVVTMMPAMVWAAEPYDIPAKTLVMQPNDDGFYRYDISNSNSSLLTAGETLWYQANVTTGFYSVWKVIENTGCSVVSSANLYEKVSADKMELVGSLESDNGEEWREYIIPDYNTQAKTYYVEVKLKNTLPNDFTNLDLEVFVRPYTNDDDDDDDDDDEGYEDIVDDEGRIVLSLDKGCGATTVNTDDVVKYSATFDRDVTCKISCTDKYQAALNSGDYTLTVFDTQGQALTPDTGGLFNFAQGVKYIITLTYTGTTPNAVRVNTIEYKGNLPTNVSSSIAYGAISTGINSVQSELETYITNNPTKEFSIANPANLDGVEDEASENLLYYLGDIYKDEGIPFSRRWVQIDDPTSNKDSQSWDPDADRNYSFVMHPYAVVYDVTKKAYLLCPKEDGLGGEKEYLYWSTEPCNFERAGKVPRKDRITDAAALWEEVQGDSFEIVYIARICIDIKEIDGDGLDACKYRAYRILGRRPFDFEMLDIQNDGVNELLEETSELRHEGWHYTDLRLINIRVQDFLIDDTLEARGKHMETFFGGLFKEKYYELVSDTAGLSIEAKVPRGDIGDVMIGVEEYQGNYWLNGQLYFMEELPHEGITYEDVMFVNPTENQTVAEAAETRLNNYLQGSGITATVEENDTELYLTEEGVIRKMEENEYYHNTGFIPTLQEIVDNGQFASMFEPSGQKTFDLYEWNEQAVIKTETLYIYPLYDVALSMEGEETKTYTMAIGKVDAETIAEKDREAYGYAEKGFNGGKFGTVRIDAQSGIIPFDIYMDAEETTVSNDRWRGNYAAIDITPGSNISNKADGNGVDGYSMKVTATGVKLGNTTLVAGDAFKVWDEENGVYLTNADGSETFTVNSDNAVEFEATHFSKYAIVPTTETYREEYVPAKPVVPEKNPNIDVDPTSGEIVANLDDEIKVTDETASTVITKETAAEIAKSITENKSTEVKLDVTVKETAGESVTKTEVEIPMAIADAAKTNGASVEIATNVGSVVLDAKTVEGIAKTGADSFTIAVEKTDATNDIQAVFDITLESVKDGKSTSISKLNGSAQVVAPLPSGLVGEKVCGLYLNGNLAEKVTTKVDGNKVTLTVKHFSTYAVMTDAAANKKFKKSAEKTTMGKLTLKAYKGGKIKAGWKNGKGNTDSITRYQVYYKTSGKKAKYITTTSKSKTINKLKKGKYYTMKVRARIKLNGKYYWSKWSSAKKIKCK